MSIDPLCGYKSRDYFFKETKIAALVTEIGEESS